MEDIFRGVGVEVTLKEADDFLKVRETLTRIGIASSRNKTLFQSCHILHKRGRYAIVHFKELFMLDGKEDNISEEDLLRRNLIVQLLDQWGLVKVVDPVKIEEVGPLSMITIVAHKQKSEWQLLSKYTVGKKKG
jgi:hypothetical protein